MAGYPTASCAQDVLDYATGRAVRHTAPFQTYVALLTSPPPSNATIAQLSEVTTPGYARQPATWSPATATTPSSTSNATVITFGPMTSDMEAEATYAALVTAAVGTDGEVRLVWQLDSGQQALAGQALQFGIGKLTLTTQ